MNKCSNSYTKKLAPLETGVSNTRLNSHNPNYKIGVDWLDFSLTNVSSGLEAERLVSVIASLASDQIDFSVSKASFHGKQWDGSGRGIAGTMVWWQAPILSPASMALDCDGNPLNLPNLVPPQHCPVSAVELEIISARLPENLTLIHDSRVKWIEDEKGNSVVAHGWQVVSTGDNEVSKPGVLKVSLSGKVMCRVDVPGLISFLSSRSDRVASRIDIALDDMGKLVSMAEVERAAREGNYFDVCYTSVIESGKRGEQSGKTVYFGSPSSDKRLRVYDKTVESEGALDCNRWEVEYRRDKATICIDAWIHAFSNGIGAVEDYLTNLVAGCLEFRDRSGDDPNRGRCPLLSWWEAMLNRLKAEPIIVRKRVVTPTLQRSIDWLKRQVAPTLAAVECVLESDFSLFLSELVYDGIVKMSMPKRRQVEQTDKQQLCY